MKNHNNDKKDCRWCTLFYCAKNDRLAKEFKGKYQSHCFIEIIGSRRPIDCNCVIKKNKEPIKEYQEMMRNFQVLEGNDPCFELGNVCDEKGG